MFKNFTKVFGYTFKNQVNAKSYKATTIIFSILFFVLPVVISLIVAKIKNDNKTDDKVLKKSDIKNVYVVNEYEPEADYSFMNVLGEDNYTEMEYRNFKSVEEAIEAVGAGDKTVIVNITKEDDELMMAYIKPSKSGISDKDIENFSKFFNKYERVLSIVSAGISLEALSELSVGTTNSVRAQGATDEEAKKNADEDVRNNELKNIQSIFKFALTFLTCMIVYFIVLMYGVGITNNIVEEKASKLMDTMLVSVSPQALMLGKMLSIIVAGILQLFIWIVSLVGGFYVAVKSVDSAFGGLDILFFDFLKSLGDYGMMKPLNCVLAFVALIAGILLFASLSTIVGAISNTREEATANQGFFVIILVIAFYIVLFAGVANSASSGADTPLWINMVPFVSGLSLPACLLAGTISTGYAIISILLTVVLEIVLIVAAGRLYKMMAFYKGNKITPKKLFSMLFADK